MLRNLLDERIFLLVFLAAAVMGLLALAAGMPSLELQTGGIIFETTEQPFIEETGQPLPPPSASERPPYTLYVAAGIVLVLFVLFLAYRYPEIRYGILGVSVFTAFLLGLIYLYTRFGPRPEEPAEDEVFLTEAERFMAELAENPPEWFDGLSILLTIIIFVIAALVIWWLWRRWEAARKPALDAIGLEAEAALVDLRSGADFRDTIMRCYFDMNQSLARSLGLRRPEGMTPREFEDELVNAGFPAADVHGLTRLFEGVRYGRQLTSESDKQEAIACLENIVLAARQEKEQSSRASALPQQG